MLKLINSLLLLNLFKTKFYEKTTLTCFRNSCTHYHRW